jgi:hypothetical protein
MAMGKLWWFAMFVIVCVVFPVVAVITIGIFLAFIMGGSSTWYTRGSHYKIDAIIWPANLIRAF